MKYSISYKDRAGVTLRSDWLSFASDDDALAYAKQHADLTAMFEVWKGEHLLARLEPSRR